jgi:hypothetical protein
MVTRKLQLILGGVAAAVIAVSVVLLATVRIQEARDFGRAHRVKTYSGTNYVVRLAETTIGRTDSGQVVIVYLVLANPNPVELILDRNWFILVDHDKDYYLPSTTGTQEPLIKIPAHGVLDREMLSFAVDTNAFEGVLGLQIGHQYWVMLKGIEPYTREIGIGEFRTFRRRDW